MKKQNILAVFMLSFLLFACGNNKTDGNAQGADETSGKQEGTKIANADEGKVVYVTNCKLCHGDDGTLGTSGAANLKTSTLKTQDLNNIVTYGKPTSGMIAYKDLLSPEDIANVVAYIETLRK